MRESAAGDDEVTTNIGKILARPDDTQFRHLLCAQVRQLWTTPQAQSFLPEDLQHSMTMTGPINLLIGLQQCTPT